MRGLPILGNLRPVLRVAVVMLGALFAVGQLTGIVPLGGDSLAYWLADPLHPYVRSTVGNGYAYLYSPAFAQAIEPLRLVPWPVFAAVWTMILAAALAWTAGPWGILLVLLPPVLASIALGNIEILMATAIVAGFRYPAAWAFVLLTKVTPGVGLVWFAVRREWRSLAIALGATAAIAAVSFAIAPAAWFEWADSLRRNAGVIFPLWTLPGPLWLRVVLAAAIVAWGARTDRRWTVPVAAAIAMPVPYWTFLALLAVGVVGLLDRAPGRGTIAMPGSRSRDDRRRGRG